MSLHSDMCDCVRGGRGTPPLPAALEPGATEGGQSLGRQRGPGPGEPRPTEPMSWGERVDPVSRLPTAASRDRKSRLPYGRSSGQAKPESSPGYSFMWGGVKETAFLLISVMNCFNNLVII